MSSIEKYFIELTKVPLAMAIYKLEEINAFQIVSGMSESGKINQWL